MDECKRDALLETISNLTTMNRIMNEQAKRIENREGILWKCFSSDEIEKRANEYDQMIEKNNRVIQACVNCLMKEYNNDMR